MHSFGNSFGFRRSNEHLFSGPESRFRVPSDATWLQGDLVTIDAASASGPEGTNLLKTAAGNAAITPGVTGLVVSYERFPTANGLTNYPVVNTRDLSAVPAGQLANIVTGAGIKVWFKNLPSDTRPGRKQYSAETRVDLTSIVVGDYIKWDGTKYVRSTDRTQSVGVVTKVIADVGVEFTLLA